MRPGAAAGDFARRQTARSAFAVQKRLVEDEKALARAFRVKLPRRSSSREMLSRPTEWPKNGLGANRTRRFPVQASVRDLIRLFLGTF